MDSGNSGSLQSSSGGDEEYDSRAAAADSVSAFMGGGPISNPSPPPPFFDPFSNYLQLHQNPNSSLLNPSLAWPRSSANTLRSDPNPVIHDIINPMLSRSSPPPFMPSLAAVGVDNSCSATVGQSQQSQNQNQAAARNPKKRSRASRRAPTTVLTTDTTNFRAMVQEFTGIPAPPFNSSPFPRSRFDLFATRSTSLDPAQPPPPYLRRPFAQKVQSPLPFLSSSSSSLLSSTAGLDAIGASSSSSSSTNNIITAISSSRASSSSPAVNYQLPITQSSNLFNIPTNPLLTSLIFPFSSSPAMASKPQVPFEIPSKIGGLDEQFGLSHGNHVSSTLAGLPNLIHSDQIAPRNDHNDNNAASWNNNPVSPGGDKDNSRPVNGNFTFPRNTINGKMNYTVSSTSNFHSEKGPENVAASRGEGMVESWICSSE